MSIDFSSKSDGELDSLIANHERKGAWGAPVLLEALAERSRRRDGGLDLDRTLDLILTTARKRRFVTYKDVAAQSERPWEKVRWKVFEHLGTLCLREHARNGVKPSVMVVTEGERETGRLDGETLAGFERICLVIDPNERLRGQALVDRERAALWGWLGVGADDVV
ncbi:MAG TPA: hypothetical protein VE684_21080 [Crenalkalicoccus sp.]|nr:hypothetical protein [Crenalkalicoccus sp.]